MKVKTVDDFIKMFRENNWQPLPVRVQMTGRNRNHVGAMLVGVEGKYLQIKPPGLKQTVSVKPERVRLWHSRAGKTHKEK